MADPRLLIIERRMTAHQSDPASLTTAVSAPEGETASRRLHADRSLGIRLVCVGLVGGILSGGLVERFGAVFQVPPQIKARAEAAGATEEEFQLFNTERKRVEYQNTALAYALIGSTLGGLLAGAVGAVRSRVALASGLVVGSLLGGLFGAAGGYISLFVAGQLDHSWKVLDATHRGMMMQAVAWCTIGVGIGLAARFPADRPSVIARTTAMMCGTALLSAILFIPLAAIVLPLSKADRAVPPDAAGRILWAILGCALISAGLAASCRNSGKRGHAAGEMFIQS